jgi:preprotein translocase subunit SecG
MEHNMPKIDDPSDRIELYKLRLEESRYRYESMRNLEWRVLFQTYAGYAAITVAFSHTGTDRFLGRLAAIAMVIFFAATNYLYFRIQERMKSFGEAHTKNMKMIDKLLDEDGPLIAHIAPLGHKFFWTYDTQLVLSTCTLLSLQIYMFKDGFTINHQGELILFSLCAGVAIFLAARLRYLASKWDFDGKGVSDEEDKALHTHSGR